MPHVLQARDGRNHTVTDERDILQLIDDYLGTDFRDQLEEWAEEKQSDRQAELAEIMETAKETEAELDRLKNHQRQVFTEVYEDAERLMDLTEAEHPDMGEIRRLAEKIWDVMGIEL